MKVLLSIPLLLSFACDSAATRHHHTMASDEAPAVIPSQRSAPEDAPSPMVSAPPPLPRVELSVGAYPWHGDPSIEALAAAEALAQRFAAPRGFTRVALPEGSFGHWLRAIPLAAPGTPVRSYEGGVHLPASHRNIAAVTTLDIGPRDLQQCADAVMRLHAEWLWSGGRAEEASYPSGGGAIPWKRYRAGGYPALQGRSFVWKSRGPRTDDHATYRKYLDAVFSWANTVALEQKTQRIDRAAVRPGDFFVLAGNPGHSVLILDIAEHADGRRVALLGQSFMPAQSFQILRSDPGEVWFSLDDDDGVQTPFWRRFPWSSARRLPE